MLHQNTWTRKLCCKKCDGCIWVDIRNAKSLSATDMGWGYYLPVRINYIIKNDTFLTTEFNYPETHLIRCVIHV